MTMGVAQGSHSSEAELARDLSAAPPPAPLSRELEERVLVFTPTGRDGVLTCEILERASYVTCCCDTARELCAEVGRGAGVAVLAEEALSPEAVECLLEELERQPSWSDLPLLVFTHRGDAIGQILEKLGTAGSITVLERPVRISTLQAAVNSALRARKRQYETRDLLKRLEEASRRKDEFLAMLGHELRNPLSAIRNALYVLERVGPDHPLTPRQHGVLDRQTRHLTRMVDDLLDVSRVTLGKITLQPQPLDLRDLVERGFQSLRALASEHSHQTHLELPEEPVLVEGDPVRLEQILTNLVNNAIKYTPPAGEIHCSVRREEGQAVIRVSDTGVGITREMLDGIFDLFTQAEVSLARSKGGLGLGLTLVKNLVEMHGGSVSAHSDGPGKGSEFTVRLPLASLSVASLNGSATATERAPDGRRKVLLVEDNADARETLREVLEIWGHAVEVAEDGRQGVEKAVGLRPEVMVVDIGLPALDGFEVARRIHAGFDGDRPGLIALTGYGQPEDRRRAIEAGFDAYLTKPVDPTELSRLLASLPQRKPEARRQNAEGG